MRFQSFPFAGQRHVAKALPLQQLREHGLQIRVVVLPPEAVLLGSLHFSGGRLRAHAALLCAPEIVFRVPPAANSRVRWRPHQSA